MGLDGISINQLRSLPEKNSSELVESPRFSLNGEVKVVDGLSQGQKIDPDKQRENEKQKFQKNFLSDDEADEEYEESSEPTIKYDLSKTDKYKLQLDTENNTILIIEKATKNIIQKIDSQELSRFVNFLSNSQGAIINRKF